MSDDRPMPLVDLRVIDLSTVIAGPSVARYLADFGADVIKVERPEGDSLRNMAWRDPRDGSALWWKFVNRNKRFVALDLKDDADRDVLLRLVDERARADRELPSGHAGAPRPRHPTVLHARNRAAGDHPPHRLRPDRAVCRPSGLRLHRRGHVGLRGDRR